MRSGVAPPTSHQNAMVNLFCLKILKEGRMIHSAWSEKGAKYDRLELNQRHSA